MAHRLTRGRLLADYGPPENALPKKLSSAQEKYLIANQAVFGAVGKKQKTAGVVKVETEEDPEDDDNVTDEADSSSKTSGDVVVGFDGNTSVKLEIQKDDRDDNAADNPAYYADFSCPDPSPSSIQLGSATPNAGRFLEFSFQELEEEYRVIYPIVPIAGARDAFAVANGASAASSQVAAKKKRSVKPVQHPAPANSCPLCHMDLLQHLQTEMVNCLFCLYCSINESVPVTDFRYYY